MILNFGSQILLLWPIYFFNHLTVWFNTLLLSRFMSKSVFIYPPVEFTLQYGRCVPEIVFNVLQDR